MTIEIIWTFLLGVMFSLLVELVYRNRQLRKSRVSKDVEPVSPTREVTSKMSWTDTIEGVGKYEAITVRSTVDLMKKLRGITRKHNQGKDKRFVTFYNKPSKTLIIYRER